MYNTLIGVMRPIGAQRAAVSSTNFVRSRISSVGAGNVCTIDGDRLRRRGRGRRIGAIALEERVELGVQCAQSVGVELEDVVAVVSRGDPVGVERGDVVQVLLETRLVRQELLPMERRQRGYAVGRVEECGAVPRRARLRGAPPALASVACEFRVLDDESIPPELAEVVAGERRSDAHSLRERGGSGRAVDPQQSDEAEPERMGQGPHFAGVGDLVRLELGHPSKISERTLSQTSFRIFTGTIRACC